MTTPDREVPKVLITVGSYIPGFRAGGPIRSVAGIVATMENTADIDILTLDRDLGDSCPYPGLSGKQIRQGNAVVRYLDPRSPGQVVACLRWLRRTRHGVVYLNSLWNPVFSVAIILAASARLIRPEVILLAPRGELSAGALSIRRSKKRAVLPVLRLLLRRLPVVWHASTVTEAAQIRAHFGRSDILVSPDPVDLDALSMPTASRSAQLRAVYIGRVSPMKNLAATLRALDRIAVPIDFDIYGPLEDRTYWEQCRAIIARLPEHIVVNYRGELQPSTVQAVFAAYDCFILPTLGENFGHAIVESLSAGCPVIASSHTPWTEVIRAGGGTIVQDASVASLRQAIERFAALPAKERCEHKHAALLAYREWAAEPRPDNVLDLLLARNPDRASFA